MKRCVINTLFAVDWRCACMCLSCICLWVLYFFVSIVVWRAFLARRSIGGIEAVCGSDVMCGRLYSLWYDGMCYTSISLGFVGVLVRWNKAKPKMHVSTANLHYSLRKRIRIKRIWTRYTHEKNNNGWEWWWWRIDIGTHRARQIYTRTGIHTDYTQFISKTLTTS